MGSMRGEMRRVGDLTLIVDCYNANPQSVSASLDVLQDQAVSGRKVAVLGTMLELGTSTSALHERVLREALARDIDIVVATGAFADAATRLPDDAHGRLITAGDWREAYPALRERLDGDEVVLLKASRGIALEAILPFLEADFGGTAQADPSEGRHPVNGEAQFGTVEA